LFGCLVRPLGRSLAAARTKEPINVRAEERRQMLRAAPYAPDLGEDSLSSIIVSIIILKKPWWVSACNDSVPAGKLKS
jgi:hypothetical protein